LYLSLALIAWIGLLGALAYVGGRRHLDFPISGLRSGRAWLPFLRTWALTGFVSFATFVPLGFLCVLTFPTRATWGARVLRVGLPAFGMSLLLATGINVLRSPKLGIPDLLTLLVPWLGCFVGWWGALTWRRGRVARILFVPQLALVGILLIVLAGILLERAVEASALPIPMPQVTSAEKRRLYALFSGKNPVKLEAGETAEVRLTDQDINLLLAWGLPLLDLAPSATVGLHPGRGHLMASVRIPGTSKFLNVAAQATFGFAAGQLQLLPERLRVGQLEIPVRLFQGLAPAAARAVMEDERIKPMVAAVRSIDLTDGAVTLRYGYGKPPRGFVASLFHEEGSETIDVEGVRAQARHLVASKASVTGNNDERFGKAVQIAFRYAQEHSNGSSAIAANRNAILVLGIALGHARVETLIGSFLDEGTRASLHVDFSRTTLRQREDWPKHFFVSAALTIIAIGRVSDATGLFKEEKDSGGGSGFSFADLLADRSGTTFAQVATRSEASARALQARLDQGFNVDDYFPPADGLPEGLQDADFQSQMGGVGGPRYNQLTAEIENRVSRCAAYAGATSGDTR
jgi:hypothetical protein